MQRATRRPADCEDRSATNTSTCPSAAPWISRAASSARARSRPVIARCAPSLARHSAVALPMPAVPPVTTTVLPVIGPLLLWSMLLFLSAIGRVEDPLEPVEDQIESEYELVCVVVAGLQHVLDSYFHEVGIRVDRELAADAVGDLDGLLGRLGWQARLLQCESVDVAIQDGVRVRVPR